MAGAGRLQHRPRERGVGECIGNEAFARIGAPTDCRHEYRLTVYLWSQFLKQLPPPGSVDCEVCAQTIGSCIE